jgi:hypothetical protein
MNHLGRIRFSAGQTLSGLASAEALCRMQCGGAFGLCSAGRLKREHSKTRFD